MCRGCWEKPNHAFRDYAKGFITRFTSLQKGAEFIDLRNAAGLNTRFFQQAADSLVGDRKLLLRGFALKDFLLLAYWVNANRK